MRAKPIIVRVALCVPLLGCSGEKPPPPPAQRPGAFDQQMKAIEAAKSVEGTLKEQDEARRRLIDGEGKP